MSCKHKELIRIKDNKKEYYCKCFDKEIPEYKCKECIMKIENQEDQLNELFGQIFGKGFNN